MAFFISYQDYLPGWVIQDDEKIFNSSIENIFNRIRATPTIKDTVVQGYPSKIVTTENPQWSVRHPIHYQR